MPTYQTKTDSAHTVSYHNKLVVTQAGSTNHWDYTWSRNVGDNKITYEEGPRYIRVDGKQMCNWKRCNHDRGEFRSGLTYHLSQWGWWRSQNYEYAFDWYDCPVVGYSSFGLSSYSGTIPPSSIVDELQEEVWADVAGRANEYLLSLEDFAGFFSGKSLWKGITGVAGAVNGVAKAIADCRKLGRAFGWKNSIYNMWISSKEAVRQALGLRLGYRFSFKTTLNDIVKAVDFGRDFGQFAREITKRNSSEFLRYSKRATVSGDPSIVLYDDAALEARFLSSSPNSAAKRYFINPYGDTTGAVRRQLPVARVLKRGGRTAVAFVKARVRYPVDYATMSHYYQGRFGLDKPLTTLWAIVPLSFVVDYLFNVQDALTYVDNKLNDYLVATNIGSAWVCNTTFRESVLDIPEATMSYNYDGSPDRPHVIHWPHMHTVYKQSEVFERTPITSSSIRAQLPSLISADDNNWVRSVGTGLELLSQTRLR
jgi:hypothetical protein